MANKKVSQLTSKPSVLVTDLFPIADPSTGQLYKTTISDLGTAIGSGVSSVNGLVGAVVLDTDDIQELVSPTNKWFTDTRARAALSASSPLAYNSGTGVFSIPAATSSQNGYLTSTDWATFNGKQAALSGTGFVKISGTTISYDNSTYLTTSAAASTYLALAGGTMTGQIVLKEASSSTDYTKGLKFPDNPFGGGGDVSGLRLYADTSVGTEAQVLELYVGNDSEVAISRDRINFATGVGLIADNNLVTINGNIIWNAGNLTPQSQLNGTGFVKASGTTITYDNSTYLTTSSASSTYLAKTGGTLTGGLSGTTAGFTGQISTGNGVDADILINVTSAGAGTKYASIQSSVTGLSLVLNHTNGGKIGIGTTSPNHLFTLSATASNKTEIGLYNTFNDAGNRNWAIATNQVAYGDFHLMQSNAKDGNPTSSGTSRLMINSSGYIGIGSTSPTLAKVVIEKSGSLFPGLMINNTTSDEATIRFKSTHSANSDYKIGASIKFDSAFEIYSVNADTTRLAVTSSGYLKASNNGTYNGVSDSYHELRNSGTDYNTFITSTSTSSPNGVYIAYTGATPNNTGNLFIVCRDSSIVDRFAVRSNGGIANYAANNVILSDERTKKEIQPLGSYWDKFKAIEIVKYKYKDQTHDDFNIGVIAQQVESVAPEFVDIDGWGETPKDGTPLKSIYDSDLHHATIGVLKEAMAKIETLEAKIKTLENK